MLGVRAASASHHRWSALTVLAVALDAPKDVGALAEAEPLAETEPATPLTVADVAKGIDLTQLTSPVSSGHLPTGEPAAVDLQAMHPHATHPADDVTSIVGALLQRLRLLETQEANLRREELARQAERESTLKLLRAELLEMLRSVNNMMGSSSPIVPSPATLASDPAFAPYAYAPTFAPAPATAFAPAPATAFAPTPATAYAPAPATAYALAPATSRVTFSAECGQCGGSLPLSLM